ARALPRHRRSAAHGENRALHPRPSAARRVLAHLLRRPRRSERHDRGVLRAEARRHRSGPRGDGARSRLHPRARRHRWYSRDRRPLTWRNAFLGIDKMLRAHERSPWKPLRMRALKACERWIVDHQEADGSWCGIQPPWVYSLIALKCLGYSNDHPVMAKGIR